MNGRSLFDVQYGAASRLPFGADVWSKLAISRSRSWVCIQSMNARIDIGT